MTDAIICACLLIGTFFVCLASLGIWRLPDVYTRLHALTKASTLGLAGCLLASALVFRASDHSIVPELLTMLFVVVTNPVGGHMIARSAYLIGIAMSDHHSVLDEMKRAGEQADREHDQA